MGKPFPATNSGLVGGWIDWC